ncbi:MAG: serine/threonine-protein kinase [Planctomycetaceae bacterium]|nr:serine/threonine-protein kinase [Planctomycetaceae bacterium]
MAIPPDAEPSSDPNSDTAPFDDSPADSGFSLNSTGRDESPDTSQPGASPSSSVESIMAGGESLLGEFRLLRLLGSGGMANVYLAEQTSLKRKVALKILRPDLLADDTYLERFTREAKAAAGLNHANIVQVFAVGEQGGLHYIAQEYVQGVNLREFLSRKGPPEAGTAVHILRQVASALKAAADAGIVHRDIKPENILLTRQGIVKVTDFGLAQLNRESDHTNLTLTQVGTTMGTPLYMSPEQVNGARVDHRSDIYSLGVTCYHLLAGRPPFRGETAISVAVQHVNQAPEPLSDSRSDLPRRLCDLVHRMMAKQPDDRVPDATTLLEELENLQRRLRLPRGGATSEWIDYEPPVSFWARATGWIPEIDLDRWRGWLILPAACLVIAVLTGSVARLSRPPDPLQLESPRTGEAPKLTRIEDQYAYAMMVDNIPSWQAVIDNFPGKSLFANRAKQKLAMRFLRLLRIEDAEKIYNELSEAGESDPELMACGLAGQAVIASIRDRFQESQDIIAQRLVALREHLGLEMESLIRNTIARNREHVRIENQQGLEELFRNAEASDQEPTD